MILGDLIKRLKDMELLYGKAVVIVDMDGMPYRITSIDGYMGEKRPNEVRDPNKVVIRIKRWGEVK